MVRVPGELLDDEIETPLVQLVAQGLPQLGRKVAPRPVDGLGDIEHVLFRVPYVYDPDRVRDMLFGEVPDPRRPVPEDDPAPGVEEPAPPDLAQDPPDEGRELPVRVAGGDRFDGRVVADGPGVENRPALLFARFRRPTSAAGIRPLRLVRGSLGRFCKHRSDYGLFIGQVTQTILEDVALGDPFA